MNDLASATNVPRPAELIWARYDKDNQSRYYLLLYLGLHDGHAVGIIADKVPDHEILAIRANLALLRQANLQSIGAWIRENLPVSYKHAYRHFEANKLFVMTNFGLEGIQKKLS